MGARGGGGGGRGGVAESTPLREAAVTLFLGKSLGKNHLMTSSLANPAAQRQQLQKPRVAPRCPSSATTRTLTPRAALVRHGKWCICTYSLIKSSPLAGHDVQRHVTRSSTKCGTSNCSGTATTTATAFTRVRGRKVETTHLVTQVLCGTPGFTLLEGAAAVCCDVPWASHACYFWLAARRTPAQCVRSSAASAGRVECPRYTPHAACTRGLCTARYARRRRPAAAAAPRPPLAARPRLRAPGVWHSRPGRAVTRPSVELWM